MTGAAIESGSAEPPFPCEFGFAPPRSRELNIEHLRATQQQLSVVMVRGDHGFYVDHPDEVATLISQVDRSA